MSEAEYQDWRQSGELRLADGHTEGKYLTVAAELAAQWGESFRRLGWEQGPGHIVRIVFPPDAARAIELIGPWIDQIGPAYLGAGTAIARVSVPFDVADEFRRIHGALYPHAAEWVTGLTREQLLHLGGVRIVDAGKVVWEWPQRRPVS